MKQLVLLLMVAMLAGCEQATPPSTPLPSGTATISDRQVLHFGGSTNVGFDFERGKTLTNVGDSCDMLAFDDISLYPTNPGKNAVKPYLFKPGSTQGTGFCFVARGGSYEEALTYFQNLKVAPDSVYHSIAELIHANEVWAFQSNNRTFAKILIRNIQTRVPQSTSDTAAVAVTFDWVFQPSGSKHLEP